jgi:hypothetical protein
VPLASRIVGKPDLTGLGKGCASLAKWEILHGIALHRATRHDLFPPAPFGVGDWHFSGFASIRPCERWEVGAKKDFRVGDFSAIGPVQVSGSSEDENGPALQLD